MVLPLVENLHKQASRLDIKFEINVYDDGSPQPELQNEIINEFTNTTYKKLENNIGRTAIRSLMAEEAKYSWLLFLDADVLPENSNFLKKYLDALNNNNVDVIAGGVVYEEKKPEKEKMLRWKYGHLREAKSVAVRQKDPHTIVSPSLCIKKSVFLNANTQIKNSYGLDNFFSNQLKKMDATVLHIENPVIHLGLEENNIFLNKALKAVETTVDLEQKGLMDTDMRPLQKSYLKLKKLHLHHVFSFFISKFQKRMEQNFNSKNPNLFWFDLYRLNHYIQLKKKYNA